MTELNNYILELTNSVNKKISDEICENKIADIVLNIMKHSTKKDITRFHEYYLKTTSDKNLFTSPIKFFPEFKRQYALQGISNKCLEKLEKAKSEIFKLIEDDELSELYYRFFSKVEVQIEGAEIKRKSLGSFFTKLVHTLNPSQYCALDNPVKDYFNLTNESFFISFIVISDAYRKWAASNYKLLNSIREEIKKVDKKNLLQISKLTDLKLFDLIFRIKATPQNNGA